jgi:hypothetical protein
MTAAERSAHPSERCWLCDGWILRNDARRVMPGLGLTVHTRCYEADAEPRPSPPTSPG